MRHFIAFILLTIFLLTQTGCLMVTRALTKPSYEDVSAQPTTIHDIYEKADRSLLIETTLKTEGFPDQLVWISISEYRLAQHVQHSAGKISTAQEYSPANMVLLEPLYYPQVLHDIKTTHQYAFHNEPNPLSVYQEYQAANGMWTYEHAGERYHFALQAQEVTLRKTIGPNPLIIPLIPAAFVFDIATSPIQGMIFVFKLFSW